MAVTPRRRSPTPRKSAPPQKRKPRVPAPWEPAAYEKADVIAIQALNEGRADAHEQRRALEWIIDKASNAYDMSFRPGGEEGSRDTDFAEGRRYVGNQIVKLTKMNVTTVFKDSNG